MENVWDREKGNSDSKNKIIDAIVSVDGNTIAPVVWHKNSVTNPRCVSSTTSLTEAEMRENFADHLLLYC